MVMSIYVPATKGYFNISETMVYTTAILFGPHIGTFAGGVVMFADLILGFPIYAPGTLAFKATEGAVVGYLVVEKSSARGLRGARARYCWVYSSVFF